MQSVINRFSNGVLHTLSARVSLLAPIQAMPGSTPVDRSFTTDPDDSCTVRTNHRGQNGDDFDEAPSCSTFCVDITLDLDSNSDIVDSYAADPLDN